jgi:hypothetical protein
MCFYIMNMCTICHETSDGGGLNCGSRDMAGYCEEEKTGPGIGSGKYLSPVHKQLCRVRPCGSCWGRYNKSGKWFDGDTAGLGLPLLPLGTSTIVDPLMFRVAPPGMAMLVTRIPGGNGGGTASGTYTPDQQGT